jgi:hypothetical protein
VGSAVGKENGWQIIHPKFVSVGGIAFGGFVGGTSIACFGVGIWSLVSIQSIGDFLGCFLFSVLMLAGLYHTMGSYFVGVNRETVIQGRRFGKATGAVGRDTIARVRWHAYGRSNCGQLMDAHGSVLMTFDPLISKGQTKVIAEILGVPFSAP